MADADCPDDRANGWKEDNDKAGTDLRWHDHVLRAETLLLTQQYKDSMERLEDRSDEEARGVLKGLVEEYRAVNESLAAFLARMSNANQGLVEMLQKSEDGRSALMMRRAAEMVVKALANAEEEVHSLKAELKEVGGQRDNYKTLLAKTNSEMELAQAYAQMGRATGQASSQMLVARADEAALEYSGSSVAEALAKQRRVSHESKALTRQQQPSREGRVISSSPSNAEVNIRDLINAADGICAEDSGESRDGLISVWEGKRSTLVGPARIHPGLAARSDNQRAFVPGGGKALWTGTGASENGVNRRKPARVAAIAGSSKSKRSRVLSGGTHFGDKDRGRRSLIELQEGREGRAREMSGSVDVAELVEGVDDGSVLSRDWKGSNDVDHGNHDGESDDAPSIFF